MSTEQLHSKVAKGYGGLGENPRNSLYWDFPRVEALLEAGCVDYDYMACAHGGARAKKQRIRSNIQRIAGRRAKCRHMHSANEWKPKKEEDGTVTLAAKEESEFTGQLVFYLAVEISIWAVEKGYAKLKIPAARILPVETGSRLQWTSLPAAALRSEAMPGYGLRLQLTPPGGYQGLPGTRYVGDMKEMPKDAYYVGKGNARLRLRKSPLAAPYVKEVDGDVEYCLRLYASVATSEPVVQEHLQALVRQEPPVKWLVVDEKPGEASHAEVLAYLVWQARKEKADPQRVGPTKRKAPAAPTIRPTAKARPSRGAGGVVGLMLPGVASSLAATIRGNAYWSDAEIHRAFRKIFPDHWLADTKLPVLEDLANTPELAAWRNWALEHCEGGSGSKCRCGTLAGMLSRWVASGEPQDPSTR